MSSAKDEYIHAIEEQLDLGDGWHATWTPGTRLAVGMVGSYDDRQFSQTATLTDRQVPYTVGPAQKRSDEVAYSSSRGVDIEAGVEGTADFHVDGLMGGEAGAKVKFSEAGAVTASFTDLADVSVVDERELARAMIQAYWNGRRLEIGDCVISRVLTAESGFVAASAEAGAEVDLSLGLNLGAGPIDVGKLKAGVDIKRRSKVSFADTMPEGATPAYRMLKLDRTGVFVFKRVVAREAIVAEENEYLALLEEGAPSRT